MKGIVDYLAYIRHKPWRERPKRLLWTFRAKLIPWLPLPWRMPDGQWLLTYADSLGFWVVVGGPFEESEVRFVSRFLQPGMTVFDLGASHGVYTILASLRVGPSGRVYAFEPVPAVFNELRRITKVNRMRNVVAERLAVGNSEGSTQMYMCLDGKEGYSSLRHPAADVKARTKIIDVTITSLDTYIQRNGIRSIDFVKMDIEGGELDALKGALSVLIGPNRPLVMCEFDDRRTQPWGYAAKDLRNFLERLDYRWFSITDNGGLYPSPAKDYYECENLVAVPLEKMGEIQSFVAET